MKTIKTITFALISIALMQSCTFQKRLYMDGYNVDWRKGAHNAEKQASVNEKSIQTPEIQDQPESANVADSPAIDDNAMASLGKEVAPSIKPTKPNSFNNPSSQIAKQNESALSKKAQQTQQKMKRSDEGGNKALRALGWVIWAIGLLFILLISILLGILICLLGILLIFAGRKKSPSTSSSTESKNDSGQYVDVVYLKNGGVIRGMIIEQTFGVQLKIQTKDGSIFVYKYDEIEKVTKEMSK